MPADRVYNVLFLCTGNSARSILGEALLNHLGQGRFRAYSAGSQPKGGYNPLTLEVLHEAGIPTERLAVQGLGRVRRGRCSEDGFRVHGLRRRRGRGLPDLARPADERTLGHRGSRGGRWAGVPAAGGVRGRDAISCATAFWPSSTCRSPASTIWCSAPRLKAIGAMEGSSQRSLQAPLDAARSTRCGRIRSVPRCWSRRSSAPVSWRSA